MGSSRERESSSKRKKSSRKKEKEQLKSEQKLKDQQKQYEFLQYPPQNQEEFRSIIIQFINSDLFKYPIHSHEMFEYLLNLFKTHQDKQNEHINFENYMKNLKLIPLLQELNDRQAIKIDKYPVGTKMFDYILDLNYDKIKQLNRQYYKDTPKCMPQIQNPFLKDGNNTQFKNMNLLPLFNSIPVPPNQSNNSNGFQLQQQQEIDSLLQKKTVSETLAADKSYEISMLMKQVSYSEEQAIKKFKKDLDKKIDFCQYGIREKCEQINSIVCKKSHFRKIIKPQTDVSLGNCSYLDTCRHMDQCKFVHYELDQNEKKNSIININNNLNKNNEDNSNGQNNSSINKRQQQWVNCDLRRMDFKCLGKFDAIMADPPWDIHMNLPYETMKDREMKALRIDLLQDNGLIFLWVTGRAMELGRECLHIWGYKRVEEIIWVKTNQLQRIIRTGRTGHWLNHSKEHCLVGIKGSPKLNTGIDCDVIVSEVRETSRKPDEIYGLIERMIPGGRKIELYGRPLNCMHGWLTLGNQLPGIYIYEEDVKKKLKETYPQLDFSDEEMENNRKLMENELELETIYNSHISVQPPFKVSGIK